MDVQKVAKKWQKVAKLGKIGQNWAKLVKTIKKQDRRYSDPKARNG